MEYLYFNCTLNGGSGYFFHVKMPGYRLASLAAATTLDFTACCIQPLLSQNPTACIAYLPVQAAVANCLLRTQGRSFRREKNTPTPQFK
jgi:hypothetical protein